MRNIDDVTDDILTAYESIQEMFQRHTELIAAMWEIHQLREELAILTGSREQAHAIVLETYRSVFPQVFLLQE